VDRAELFRELKLSARRSAVLGVLTFGVALLVFLGAGAVRLWPRISGQHLPFSMIWPFARPLLAVALELSFLVSVPIALALSASSRAARAQGVASWRVSALSTAVLVVGLGLLSFGVSSLLDSGRSSPGELASELVASARESCVESSPPAEVSVPLVGFSWVCEKSHAPRLHGRAPVGNHAEFEASTIELSDDLRHIALARFTLAFTTASIPVRVHAEHATLTGLPPWGRSRRLPFGLRSCLFVLSVSLAGYGVTRLAARVPWLRWWAGGLCGVWLSGWLWFAESWLERREPRFQTYLALPVSGALALASVAVLLWLGRLLWLRAVHARTALEDL
jgi:hypothetical protein